MRGWEDRGKGESQLRVPEVTVTKLAPDSFNKRTLWEEKAKQNSSNKYSPSTQHHQPRNPTHGMVSIFIRPGYILASGGGGFVFSWALQLLYGPWRYWVEGWPKKVFQVLCPGAELPGCDPIPLDSVKEEPTGVGRGRGETSTLNWLTARLWTNKHLELLCSWLDFSQLITESWTSYVHQNIWWARIGIFDE